MNPYRAALKIAILGLGEFASVLEVDVQFVDAITRQSYSCLVVL